MGAFLHRPLLEGAAAFAISRALENEQLDCEVTGAQSCPYTNAAGESTQHRRDA